MGITHIIQLPKIVQNVASTCESSGKTGNHQQIRMKNVGTASRVGENGGEGEENGRKMTGNGTK